MEKIKFRLENCYGIKKLHHTLDFGQSSVHLIYAPNGAMKTSFARTLEDIASNVPSKDRIFTRRITHRDIKVDEIEIRPEEIFVIQRMKDADFKEASTILTNAELKAAYDSINLNLNESKSEFLKSLEHNFGMKESLIEKEISEVFGAPFFSAIESLDPEVNGLNEPIYGTIIYNEIYNDKVLKFLSSKDFKIKIKEYITTYDKLVNENTTLFMKGTFNHYNADTVAKSLKDNNFFTANHKVKINNQEIDDIDQLSGLIKAERDKVLLDPELTSKFNEIDKSLNSSLELRKFRNYIESNQEIIKEFVDIKNFSKKLITMYLASDKSAFNVLLKLYKDTNTQRLEIIEEAKKEQEQWNNVLEIFVRRFTVPFKIKIKNQDDVILKNEVPILVFIYTDGEDTVELGGTALLESLSTGEQRVFYLLNIIFQIESRRLLPHSQLIIVDDIADSFDYKNKYAIIEYLKDVLDDDKFKMIILTHNFDFYKTIKARLGSKLNYEGNWKTLKSPTEIRLVQGEKRDVFPTLRKDFITCDYTFIACIPFVRNLVEFTIGSDNPKYLFLTSLLHLKPADQTKDLVATVDVVKSSVFTVFNSVFGLSAVTEDPETKVFDLIMEKATAVYESNIENGMDIKYKICLSLAIRLKAEQYMLDRILDQEFKNIIWKKQTGHIAGQFKKEFPALLSAIGILDRVNLMTPENIHVNSFMYEPLMDLSDDHLKTLYKDVSDLV